MFILLSLLGCNPEHNAADLAIIHDLHAERTTTMTELESTQGALESAKDIVQSLEGDLEGFKVVAAAYAQQNKFAGNSLVVCHDMTREGFVPVNVNNTPGAGTPRPPWIQVDVTEDCGTPTLLIYASPPATSQVAFHVGGMMLTP